MKYLCRCIHSTTVSQPCTERRLLLGLAVLASMGLSACDKKTGSLTETLPVAFDSATACELDGMLLADYAGPKAQIHYAGLAAPVFFCDTVELFDTLLRAEQVRKISAVFVQDMGLADWEQPRGHWTGARSAVYVQGSRRHGSMGPTLASFSLDTEAKKFIQLWGGKILRFDEITTAIADLSGGALHDSRM